MEAPRGYIAINGLLSLKQMMDFAGRPRIGQSGPAGPRELNSDNSSSAEEITRPPFTAPAHIFDAVHIVPKMFSNANRVKTICFYTP